MSVVKGEVTDINLSQQIVRTNLGTYERAYEYDSLILAAGAGQSYFGNDHFAQFAPGMKTIDDALEIRARLIGSYERAELTDDPAERERLLTFVIVGAGPTGVELAGQLAEMAHRTLAGEYRNFTPEATNIVLLDGAPQVLPPFGKRLGRKAQRQLEKLGVTVKLGALVTNVDATSVTYTADGEEHTIDTYTKIWSAGVAASPLGKTVAEQAGLDVDRAGRVPVNGDCSVGEYRNVFVIGDMMSLNRLPGVAQVAIQTGQYVGGLITDEVEALEHGGDAHGGTPGGAALPEREPFDYFDKGSMATISRFSAVVKMGSVEVSGFMGWVLWLAVHVTYLVGFRNRLVTAVAWGLNVLSPKRWNLATTRQQYHARTGLNRLAELADAVGEETPVEVKETGSSVLSAKQN